MTKMTKKKMVCLSEEQYSDLVRAKAKHEYETGTRLSGLGAAIALFAGLYLLGKGRKEQAEQQLGERRGIKPR